MKYRNLTIIVVCLLIVSISLNLYFYNQSRLWEEAFFEQAGSTLEIEMIFKASKSDKSYDNMLSISKELFKDMVKEVEAEDIHIQNSADKKAIEILSATLLFKNGYYYGSKVHVPGH